MPLTKRIHLGRVPIDVMTFTQALDAIEALVDADCGGAVFTPNVDHIVQAETNDALAAAYSRVSLSFADGAPVVWASKLLGTPLPERVSGADLCLPLLQLAGRRSWRVALFGGAPGVVSRTAQLASENFGTQVVSWTAPQVDLTDRAQLDEIAEVLSAARPHLAFIALGAPKQELLIDHLRSRMGASVCLGIGAGLDFIAGAVKRAPATLRRVGLEWAFRLAQEPRRMWRRYLIQDPHFAAIVARSLIASRHKQTTRA